MDRFTRAVLTDFILGVVWPAMETFTATAGQTDFNLAGEWETAHDTPLAWVNGNRVVASWVDADTVRLPAPCVAGDRVHVLVSPGAGSGYLPRGGGLAMLGDLLMGAFRIRGLAQSQQADDAVRRDEVAGLAAAALGSTLLHKNGANWPPTAHLPMGGRTLTGLGAADADDQPVRRDQVPLRDGSQGFTAPVAGVAPTADAHLATMAWVLAQIGAAGALRLIDASLFTASQAAIDTSGNNLTWTQHVYISVDCELPLANVVPGASTHRASTAPVTDATFVFNRPSYPVSLSAWLLAVGEVGVGVLAVQLDATTQGANTQWLNTAGLAVFAADGVERDVVLAHTWNTGDHYAVLSLAASHATASIDGRSFRHYTLTWKVSGGTGTAKLGTDYSGFRSGQRGPGRTPWFQHMGFWRTA